MQNKFKTPHELIKHIYMFIETLSTSSHAAHLHAIPLLRSKYQHIYIIYPGISQVKVIFRDIVP
jgi:hypothetical protein